MGWKEFRKSSHARGEYWKGQHRFEHWYVDNQVYFITARVRDRYHAFSGIEAREIFWDRFEHYTSKYSYAPWVTSLLDNHYHTLGYLRVGTDLPKFIQHLHGSVAKLVNDTLPHRITPFWLDRGHQRYFDGCIRDELQARRAYRYTLLQCRRHKICHDWTTYHDTCRHLDLDRAVRRAHELNAFLEQLPYKRYQKRQTRKRTSRWDD